MPTSTPTPSQPLLQQQQAVLLHQLAIAPEGRLSSSDANKAIPKQIKTELQLTPAVLKHLWQSMAESGWLTEIKNGRVTNYSLTEVGEQQSRELERNLPLLPAGGKFHVPADERVRAAREVYVLNSLSHAPSQTISKGDLDLGFGGKGKPKVAELVAMHPQLAPFRDQLCLGLNPATTRAVLSKLALRGDISVRRAAGSESYSLTPAGTDALGRLRSEWPVLPPAGKPTPAPNDVVRRGREAFLLLRLLQSTKCTLWESDAAHGSYPKPLKLNHATAWQVRSELAAEGHIATHWDGKEGSYTLRPSGKRYLASLSFDALDEVKIKGTALTELLAAARGGTTPATRGAPGATDPYIPHVPPGDGQFETAVLDIFHELLAGLYANLRMVPIHEIRRAVAERFGPDAATHSVFNERVLALRRAKQVRLISIDDRSTATPDQLRDSVFAVGETFFYMEKADAPV